MDNIINHKSDNDFIYLLNVKYYKPTEELLSLMSANVTTASRDQEWE